MMPVREYYQRNKEHLREYNRRYKREWLKKKPDDYNREYLREWKKRNPEKCAQNIAKANEYMRSNPIQIYKNKARNKTRWEIWSGRLKRLSCSIDGCEAIGQAHHEDYDKPLEITWLCKAHHYKHHVELRRNQKEGE